MSEILTFNDTFVAYQNVKRALACENYVIESMILGGLLAGTWLMILLRWICVGCRAMWTGFVSWLAVDDVWVDEDVEMGDLPSASPPPRYEDLEARLPENQDAQGPRGDGPGALEGPREESGREEVAEEGVGAEQNPVRLVGRHAKYYNVLIVKTFRPEAAN